MKMKVQRFLSRCTSPVEAQQRLANAVADAALAGTAVLVLTGVAMAGTDTTFGATATTIQGWAEGSLGKMAAVGGIAVGLIGLVAKFDWRLIAGAVGIGLTAATGPSIVSGLASAIF
jgi:conjugal transfer pilus assembly protein TraA